MAGLARTIELQRAEDRRRDELQDAADRLHSSASSAIRVTRSSGNRRAIDPSEAARAGVVLNRRQSAMHAMSRHPVMSHDGRRSRRHPTHRVEQALAKPHAVVRVRRPGSCPSGAFAREALCRRFLFFYQAVSLLHERRAAAGDRAADFRRLALLWFAVAGGDANSHRLWRAAFALSPARHLALAVADAKVSANTPWRDSPGIAGAAETSRTRRATNPRRTARILDRSAEAQRRSRPASQKERLKLKRRDNALATFG